MLVFDNITLGGLRRCALVDWQPKIGDPSIMGWVTVGAYLATFFLCLLVLLRALPASRAARVFWLMLAILMLFLAFNKQLDLQSFATAAARCLAKMQGWYDNRQVFQIIVIAGLGLASLLVGLLFLWALRNDIRSNALALTGMVFVFGFVLIRAVGFHFFDQIINLQIGPIRMNWILELSGLVLISLNAVGLLRHRTK